MGLPDFPAARISTDLPQGERLTVEALCERAAIPCRVSGPPARRWVRLGEGRLAAIRQPGAYGEVWLAVPKAVTPRRRALLALGLMAYSVFDYTARECLYGRPEADYSRGPGRPATGSPLTNAERQRRFREKRA